MAKVKEITNPGKAENAVNRFLGANKKILIIVGTVVVVALLGLWIGLNIADSNAEKLQVAVDELQVSYTEWAAMDDKTSAEALSAKDDLVAGLSELASKSGTSYPIVKAEYLLGLVLYTEEDYTQALSRFASAAQKGEGTYLGSLSLFNAGVASEQLGDTAKALEYYQSVYDKYGSEAPEAPKALFSVARLHEANNSIALAKAVFQQLADEYPSSEYAKLAQSRLVVLQ